MTAAIYLRKSRSDEGDPDVLSRHRQTLLDFAQQQGLCIAQVYEEVVSGSSLYLRPQMLRLLEDVGALRYDAVLCMDIDRLGRGDMTSQGIILDTFRHAGCKIMTPRRVYDLNDEMDETYSEFEAFMARQEYKLIVRRMHRGVLAAAKEGAHVSEVPFGYVRAWQGKRPTLEPDPYAAPWVQTAFVLYAGGQGCQRIAGLFNGAGVPPKKSAQWSRTAIRRILQNPVYTGTLLYNRTRFQRKKRASDTNRAVERPKEEWIVVKDAFPALVSQQQFDQVQRQFASRSHSSYFTGEFKNPLAGLVFCGHCGQKLQRQYQPSKGGKPVLLCRTAGCSPSIPLASLEQAVLGALARESDHFQNLGPVIQGERQKQGALEALNGELHRIGMQKGRLCDLLEQGIYSAEDYARRQQELARREKEAQNQLHQLEQARKIEMCCVDKPAISPLEYYDRTEDINEKNKLLRCLITRVEYCRIKDGSRQFSLTTYPLEK